MPSAFHDYELGVIISPEIGDDAITASIERVHQSVTSRGGEIVDMNHWGRRRLAYPIGPHMEGNYVFQLIKLDPTQVRDLESSLRISDEVIRHMVIRTDE